MKIIQPYATLIEPDSLKSALSRIEAAGRVSHRSEEDQKADTWNRFIASVVMNHGDWSIVEHVTASVEFYVDRGITHEIVRHRLFSYTQESTRFVNYQKKMPPAFVYPEVEVSCPYCLSGNEPDHDTDEKGGLLWFHPSEDEVPECFYNASWLSAIYYAEKSYRKLLDDKWPPQLARSVFPNALASKIIMTGNLRCWRHFLRMRTTREAHPQMRQVTIPLLSQFQAAVPLIFDDIVPGARQADNVRLPC